MNVVEIGAAVRAIRREHNLSAQELANRTGGQLSRSVIANIESGRKHSVTVDELLGLAEALGCRAVDLLPSLADGDGGHRMPGPLFNALRAWAVAS